MLNAFSLTKEQQVIPRTLLHNNAFRKKHGIHKIRVDLVSDSFDIMSVYYFEWAIFLCWIRKCYRATSSLHINHLLRLSMSSIQVIKD